MCSVTRKQLLICLCLILVAGTSVQAQESSELSRIEEDLLASYELVIKEVPFNRTAIADSFYADFCAALTTEDAFSYPFEKLERIGKIYSKDKRLRIFTWNIPVGYGENLYYGIIHYYSKHEKQYKLAPLNKQIQSGLIGIKKDWEGALYYGVVETRHAGQRYYTLLGLNLGTPLSNSKMIDVVSVDEFDGLYFPENLINKEGKKQSRLSFEYNEKLMMSLNYNEQTNMIIFDHLSPAKPSQKGQYEFYGPDFTYDGLKWEKGVWVFYSEIDVTN